MKTTRALFSCALFASLWGCGCLDSGPFTHGGPQGRTDAGAADAGNTDGGSALDAGGGEVDGGGQPDAGPQHLGVAVPPDGPEWGSVYYVRPLGGSAAQCTGLANTDYEGAGTAESCAWKSPLVALPPTGAPRMHGGDKLIITSGSYQVGAGAGADAECQSVGTGCALQPVPSGLAADRPTRIYGEVDADGACAATPQLWGSGHARAVMSLVGANDVRVACLELTDHAECLSGANHPNAALACGEDEPYAAFGLEAKDSSRVSLYSLDVHGLSDRGVYAARLTDWSLFNVRIAANPLAGWDGDIYEGDETNKTNDSNSGLIYWKNVTIESNGCLESYPGKQPFGCFGQYNINEVGGGYGDGAATGYTGGNWLIEDSTFRYNVSDGLDLLYHTNGGTIRLNRVRAEGNAGNQIKLRGVPDPAYLSRPDGPQAISVKDSLIIGNCGYYARTGAPAVSTSTRGAQPLHVLSLLPGYDSCRALGDSLVLGNQIAGDTIEAINNTIISEANVSLLLGGPVNSTATIRNNILFAKTYFVDSSRNAGDTYWGAEDLLTVDTGFNIKYATQNTPDCDIQNTQCVDPELTRTTDIDDVDLTPLPNSPAIDTGVSTGPFLSTVDYVGAPRPHGSGYDIGAYEAQTP